MVDWKRTRLFFYALDNGERATRRTQVGRAGNTARRHLLKLPSALQARAQFNTEPKRASLGRCTSLVERSSIASWISFRVRRTPPIGETRPWRIYSRAGGSTSSSASRGGANRRGFWTDAKHGCLACSCDGREDELEERTARPESRHGSRGTTEPRSKAMLGFVRRTWSHLSRCRSGHRRW